MYISENSVMVYMLQSPYHRFYNLPSFFLQIEGTFIYAPFNQQAPMYHHQTVYQFVQINVATDAAFLYTF